VHCRLAQGRHRIFTVGRRRRYPAKSRRRKERVGSLRDAGWSTCGHRGSHKAARHERSYEREVVVFDPLHYLALLEQKTRALDQAAPLDGWLLPGCFAQLRRLLEARLKKHGSREYVQVLRLMETFALAEVSHAIEDALLLGTISFDAVRHLLLCRIERRPPRLDMDNYPHLPMAQVRTTHAADYMTLLAEACA